MQGAMIELADPSDHHNKKTGRMEASSETRWGATKSGRDRDRE